MKTCRPIRIVSSTTQLRGRLGGRPPLKVAPRYRSDDTAYFATFPLDGVLDVSVFLSVTWDQNPQTSVWHLAHRVLGDDIDVVETVVHSPARRARRSLVWELVTATSLRLGEEREDRDPDWSGCRYLGHKYGGRAGFKPGHQHLEQEVRTLEAERFTLLAQLAFPSRNDAPIDASWPFGEMTFHLFCRESSTVPAFRYLWTK